MDIPNLQAGTLSRRTAIFAVARWIQTSDFPERLIAQTQDHSFVLSLVYETVKMRRMLDWALVQHLHKKAYGFLEASLLVGACQILRMPEIPAYATLNSTVEAAKSIARNTAGIVNAVLRQILNNRESLLQNLERQPLAVRLSHPDNLVTRWRQRYGDDATEALCRWNNEPAQTSLALLPHTGLSAADYLRQASDADIPLTLHPAAPATHLLVPHGSPRLDTFPGYDRGLFIVQDPATLHAIDLLAVRPGLSVLDACAAPGGKTLQIASRMILPDADAIHGRLVAMEKHQDRIATLRANIDRAGLQGIDIQHADAAADSEPVERFDRILLDLPCSNTGVLRRRPDARWRCTARRFQLLHDTQRALLSVALRRLAPSGRLVYSTCSLEPEENLQLIHAVLRDAPDFHMTQHNETLPCNDHTDGMFAAVIEKATVT